MYQFTVCVTHEGYNIEINGLKTPIVEASSFWEAINHPDIVAFCEINKCRVYKRVEGIIKWP